MMDGLKLGWRGMKMETASRLSILMMKESFRMWEELAELLQAQTNQTQR